MTEVSKRKEDGQCEARERYAAGLRCKAKAKFVVFAPGGGNEQKLCGKHIRNYTVPREDSLSESEQK